ncbi:Reverse transcriptase domain-containing protein, partial [Aphis craccivora]
SRGSFLGTCEPLTKRPADERLEKWKEESANPDLIKETLPLGHQLPYRDWKTLNRIRTGTDRTRLNLVKWGIEENSRCDCGRIQDDEHLLKYTNTPYNIHDKNDLFNTLTDRSWHSVSMCVMVRGVPHPSHVGGSSFDMRYPCVNLECPILSLFIVSTWHFFLICVLTAFLMSSYDEMFSLVVFVLDAASLAYLSAISLPAMPGVTKDYKFCVFNGLDGFNGF